MTRKTLEQKAYNTLYGGTYQKDWKVKIEKLRELNNNDLYKIITGK